jgi:hypothetical protein
MRGYEFFWFEMYEKVADCCDVASCCGALPTEGVLRKGTVRRQTTALFTAASVLQIHMPAPAGTLHLNFADEFLI